MKHAVSGDAFGGQTTAKSERGFDEVAYKDSLMELRSLTEFSWESNIKESKSFIINADEEWGPAVDLMFPSSHMTRNRFDWVIRLFSHHTVALKVGSEKNTLHGVIEIDDTQLDFKSANIVIEGILEN